VDSAAWEGKDVTSKERELPELPVAEDQSDPWDLRRAEVLLASLKGVLSARVVASSRGEITEIHVLTDKGMAPKQVVRNVESALLAQLGIKVDHRKISVAQTAEVLPLEAVEERAVAARARKRGIIFHSVEVAPSRKHRVSITVKLERDGEEVMAHEEAGDTPKMRLQAAARATVAALDGLLEEGSMDLAGAKFVDAFDATFAFVGVDVMTGRESRIHAGTCQLRGSPERAAVLAVLDATNRWLSTYL
jgi:hypothetical protein